jgi:hypothetical protein
MTRVDEPGDLAMSDGWEHARAAADLCDRKLGRRV